MSEAGEWPKKRQERENHQHFGDKYTPLFKKGGLRSQRHTSSVMTEHTVPSGKEREASVLRCLLAVTLMAGRRQDRISRMMQAQGTGGNPEATTCLQGLRF